MGGECHGRCGCCHTNFASATLTFCPLVIAGHTNVAWHVAVFVALFIVNIRNSSWAARLVDPVTGVPSDIFRSTAQRTGLPTPTRRPADRLIQTLPPTCNRLHVMFSLCCNIRIVLRDSVWTGRSEVVPEARNVSATFWWLQSDRRLFSNQPCEAGRVEKSNILFVFRHIDVLM